MSLVRHSSLSRVSHESLTGLSVRSSLVCLLVQLLGSWSLPRGWSATRLSPIRRWSWPLVHLLVRRALLCPLLCPLLSCLLFCHQSVCSGHGRWLAHPLVVCCSCVIGHGRRSATHAPLVCLLVFPAARLPVALPLVRRCSACWSVCWCVAGLSVGASLVCLLVHHWSICSCITGPSVRASLVYLLLCRWSVCSFVARPYVRVMSLVRLIIRLVVHRSSPIPLRWSAGPSARVMVGVSSLVHLLVSHWLVHLLVSHWLVHLLVSHWPVYWSRGHGSYRWSVCSLVTRPSVRVMSLVRLLESWSLVRLIGSWPLACSSVAGLLFVRRWPWSSICHWYIARASARLVVGVSLVCC